MQKKQSSLSKKVVLKKEMLIELSAVKLNIMKGGLMQATNRLLGCSA